MHGFQPLYIGAPQLHKALTEATLNIFTLCVPKEHLYHVSIFKISIFAFVYTIIPPFKALPHTWPKLTVQWLRTPDLD
jgi:hypothetical protein